MVSEQSILELSRSIADSVREVIEMLGSMKSNLRSLKEELRKEEECEDYDENDDDKELQREIVEERSSDLLFNNGDTDSAIIPADNKPDREGKGLQPNPNPDPYLKPNSSPNLYLDPNLSPDVYPDPYPKTNPKPDSNSNPSADPNPGLFLNPHLYPNPVSKMYPKSDPNVSPKLNPNFESGMAMDEQGIKGEHSDVKGDDDRNEKKVENRREISDEDDEDRPVQNMGRATPLISISQQPPPSRSSSPPVLRSNSMLFLSSLSTTENVTKTVEKKSTGSGNLFRIERALKPLKPNLVILYRPNLNHNPELIWTKALRILIWPKPVFCIFSDRNKGLLKIIRAFISSNPASSMEKGEEWLAEGHWKLRPPWPPPLSMPLPWSSPAFKPPPAFKLPSPSPLDFIPPPLLLALNPGDLDELVKLLSHEEFIKKLNYVSNPIVSTVLRRIWWGDVHREPPLMLITLPLPPPWPSFLQRDIVQDLNWILEKVLTTFDLSSKPFDMVRLQVIPNKGDVKSDGAKKRMIEYFGRSRDETFGKRTDQPRQQIRWLFGIFLQDGVATHSENRTFIDGCENGGPGLARINDTSWLQWGWKLDQDVSILSIINGCVGVIKDDVIDTSATIARSGIKDFMRTLDVAIKSFDGGEGIPKGFPFDRGREEGYEEPQALQMLLLGFGGYRTTKDNRQNSMAFAVSFEELNGKFMHCNPSGLIALRTAGRECFYEREGVVWLNQFLFHFFPP